MAIPFRSLRYPAPGAAGLGRPVPAHGARGERVLVPHADAGRVHAARHGARVAGGHAGRPRGAEGRAQPRGEAVRARRTWTTDLAATRRTRTTRRPPPASTPSTRSGTASSPTRTVNTDFAQVEDDEQQVNLTRFSLFFPERRDFFLEGAGIFAFGGASVSPRGGGGGPAEQHADPLLQPDRSACSNTATTRPRPCRSSRAGASPAGPARTPSAPLNIQQRADGVSRRAGHELLGRARSSATS